MKCLPALAAAALLAAPHLARADYHVISPTEIDLGELEIEHNGDAVIDNRADHSGATSYTAELGTGLTPWWHAEIELGTDRDPGPNAPTLIRELVLENTFELTAPGEYAVDAGFYVEYSQSVARGGAAAANAVTFGPLFQKDIGRITETLNLLLDRQFGPDQTTQGLGFTYALQTRYNYSAPFSPAFEIYGDTGTLGATPRLTNQPLLAGPVAVGAIRLNQLGLGHAGKFKYELGYLFGATNASDRGVIRWRFELEIPF